MQTHTPRSSSTLPSLPWDQRSEQEVLAWFLSQKNPHLPFIEMGGITPDDFHSPLHRSIYQGMLELLKSSPRVWVQTLEKVLGNDPYFQHDCPQGYLKEIQNASPLRATAKMAGERLKELGRKRAVMQSCMDVVENLGCGAMTMEDAREELSRAALRAANIETAGPERVEEIVPGWLERLADKTRVGLKTGFVDLDRIAQGMASEEMILLGARPSNGKTAFALNVAYNVAMQGGHVAIFSLEMGQDSLLNRFAAAMAGVDGNRFRAKDYDTHEWARIQAAAERIKKLPMIISDCNGITPSRMREKIKAWHSVRPLDLFVVDYVQLMRPDGKPFSRENEISQISGATKTLCKEMGIPGLVLAQVNRKGEEDGELHCRNLRESGSLEQDADQVWFIQPWDKQTVESNVKIKFTIDKSRNSGTGSCDMVFQRNILKFNSLARQVDEF